MQTEPRVINPEVNADEVLTKQPVHRFTLTVDRDVR